MSPIDCDVSECDRETSTMRRPWPNRGCCAMRGEEGINKIKLSTGEAQKNRSQGASYFHPSPTRTGCLYTYDDPVIPEFPVSIHG